MEKTKNEQLNDLYCSPNFIRLIKARRVGLAVHVARIGDSRSTCRVSEGRSEVKRPLGRYGRR